MYLGIDIGTSAVKVVVVAPDGSEIASRSEPLSLQTPRRNWSEQDPQAWWGAARAACAALRRDDPKSWQAVRAIGLSGQMHGAVLLDKDRQVIRPAILWNDGRSMEQCREIEARLPEVGQLCGVPAMPGMTAPKVLWVKENEPENYRRIRHVLLPKDHVRLMMTCEMATDMADAAGTMWLDQKNRCWSEVLCEASATDPSWLPQCFEGTEVSGKLTPQAAEALGLEAGIIVAAGAGDAAAGAMGVGAIEDGDAFISLGTSGQLFVCSDRYQPNPESVVHAFAHCVPERWSTIAAMLNGASPMQWFASIANADIHELLCEAQALGEKRMPFFLPYLTGERTPHNNADIRGGFYGMEAGTDRAAMMRAVVDAIAYSFCDAKDAIEAAGRTIVLPAAIGGGAQSDFVLQTMSDALGLPIQRYEGAQTGPALGVARLAMVASGDFGLEAAAVKPGIDRVFEPAPEKAGYHAGRLATYRALYKALKPIDL